MTDNNSSFKVPPDIQASLDAQVAMLRNNQMGAAADYIMVITTTGRKSGQRYSKPIGYIRDGDTIVAINRGGISNWYKNALINPEVTLEIKGETIQAQCEPVHDPAEKQKIFDLYKRERGANFDRFFEIPVDSPAEELDKARDSRVYVRFHPIR